MYWKKNTICYGNKHTHVFLEYTCKFRGFNIQLLTTTKVDTDVIRKNVFIFGNYNIKLERKNC